MADIYTGFVCQYAYIYTYSINVYMHIDIYTKEKNLHAISLRYLYKWTGEHKDIKVTWSISLVTGKETLSTV